MHEHILMWSNTGGGSTNVTFTLLAVSTWSSWPSVFSPLILQMQYNIVHALFAENYTFQPVFMYVLKLMTADCMTTSAVRIQIWCWNLLLIFYNWLHDFPLWNLSWLSYSGGIRQEAVLQQLWKQYQLAGQQSKETVRFSSFWALMKHNSTTSYKALCWRLSIPCLRSSQWERLLWSRRLFILWIALQTIYFNKFVCSCREKACSIQSHCSLFGHLIYFERQ